MLCFGLVFQFLAASGKNGLGYFHKNNIPISEGKGTTFFANDISINSLIFLYLVQKSE